jgi:uncharacterized protein YgbK (DUF1537 family)
MRLVVVADDLSGAAECAAAIQLRTTRNSLSLGLLPRTGLDPDVAALGDALTIDSAARGLSAAETATALVALGSDSVVRDASVVVVKVDSLLRGRIGISVAALAAATGRTPVVATALPVWGRHVRGGVVHVHDVPLHETTLWEMESVAAPGSVAEALAPLRSCTLTPSGGDTTAMASSIAESVRAGLVPVFDGATDEDQDAVVAAGLAASTRPLFVGSAALVGAVARALFADGPSSTRADDALAASARRKGLLIAVGSRAPQVAEQVRLVSRLADTTTLLDPRDLLDPRVDIAPPDPGSGLHVVAIDPAADADPHLAESVSAAFADLVAGLAMRSPAVLLSGGETARAVLDRLGVRTLTPVGQTTPGTVLCLSDDGRLIITRPGSFGDPDDLVLTAQAVVSTLQHTKEPQEAT